MRRILLVIFSFIIVFPIYAQSLEQMSAKDAYVIGKDFILHEKTTEAKKYLKYSADHHNVDAMYRYAMLVWNKRLIMPDEARKYMSMAASLGHEWAMLEMAADKMLDKAERNSWRFKFQTKIQPYVDKNNPDALYLMSVLDNDDDSRQEDWLIRAEEAGSCRAKVNLAEFYNAKHGWFLFPWRREKRIETLFKEGAHLGCFQGISGYAFYLEQRYGIEKAMVEWQRLVDLGDSATIIHLALSYADPEIVSSQSTDQYFDSEKSALYFKIYLDGVGRVSGNEDSYDGITKYYKRTMDTLNDEEKQKVYDSAKKYLKHHDVKKIDDVFEMEFK